MRSGLLLALFALAGCSFDSQGVRTIDNFCGGSSGCPQGACEGNICVDDSGASVNLAIEVLRSTTDVDLVAPASWAFAVEPASGTVSRELLLPATRRVTGTVRWDGTRVPATLRFVRRMDDPVAPLAPVAIEVDTLREPSNTVGSEPLDFSTVLVSGATYDLTVLPSSDMVLVPGQEPAPAIRALPPLYLELQVDDADPSEPFRFDVTFPAGIDEACTLNLDTGCTLNAEVYSFDSGTQIELPEAGLQVRAIDKTSGRVVSSIAETDEGGHFAIRISDAASDYLIRVTSSVGRDPFPAVSVDPDLVFAGDPINQLVYIPRLASLQATGQVRDKLGRPVPGAIVRFLSLGIFGGSQLGLEGSFSGSATSGEDGSFGAELLPGLYSITVTPPEDGENNWGILTGNAVVGEDATTIETLTVPSQIGLAGTISTFRDEPASGVSVLVRARSPGDPGAVHRSQETVSSDLGDFAMSVDIGLYDMHLKVPAESGFAWLVEPGLEMNLDAGDLQKDYRLEPPIPVYGVVRSSDGEPVANALVRGYLLSSVAGGSERPLQVAEAMSGEDGSYRLLIAPRFADE